MLATVNPPTFSSVINLPKFYFAKILCYMVENIVHDKLYHVPYPTITAICYHGIRYHGRYV